MSSSDRNTSQVSFCPFCREAFEGLPACPDHDLPLVPFSALPVRAKPLPSADEALPIVDLRFGRGLLAAGALVNAAGFLGPFVTVEIQTVTTWTTSSLAATALPTLWTVPVTSGLCLWLLVQFRTLARMQGLRVLVPAISLFVPIVLVSGYFKLLPRIHEHADSLHPAQVTVGWGPILSTIGAVVMVVAGLRLGVVRESEP